MDMRLRERKYLNKKIISFIVYKGLHIYNVILDYLISLNTMILFIIDNFLSCFT